MAQSEVWRAAVVGSFAGQEVVNVWHFRMKSSADPPTTIADYLNTYVYSLWKTKCANQISWSTVECRRLSVPAIGEDVTWAPALVGSDSSNYFATTTAVVVSLKTGYLGRSYRGRLYLPGLKSADYYNGQMANTDWAAVQTYFDDVVAAVGESGASSDLTWGVFSRKLGEIKDGEGHITSYDLTKFFPVTDALVRQILHVQRRRAISTGS